MQEVNAKNINEFVVNGVFEIAASLKPFKGAPESDRKFFTLKMNCENVPLKSIVDGALKDARITWANANRKNWEHLEDRSTVMVNFKSPGTRELTKPEMIEKMVKMGIPREVAELAINNPDAVKAAMAE